MEYFRNCLETDLVGSVVKLDDELRAQYEAWLADDDLLLHQAVHELRQRRRFAELEKIEDEKEQLRAWLGTDLPPPHIYRPSYDLGLDDEVSILDFDAATRKELRAIIAKKRKEYLRALADGVLDMGKPLERTRRLWFRRQVAEYTPDNYPEDIPSTFEEAVCTVFGHVCPVFFSAEALTETEEERRIGRGHLSFRTMMRIVRRDDYRCQHCQKQLMDNEVEFDHIIPVSKGGSSEEHNLRLTCFDCNRDKSDDFAP